MVNKLWRRILDWSSCCQKIFDTLRFIRLLNEVSGEEKITQHLCFTALHSTSTSIQGKFDNML